MQIDNPVLNSAVAALEPGAIDVEGFATGNLLPIIKFEVDDLLLNQSYNILR